MSSDPQQKIGILIPEFPGQTHIFFWRELRALREMGVDVEVISTRRPERSWICHEWSKEAMQTTTYLRESSILDIAVSLRQLLTVGPRGWIKSLRLAILSDAPTLKDRLRAIAAIPVGARLATIARRRGLVHIHAHSCGASALIALQSNLLGGPSYSLTLHGPLSDYGPDQRQKWGGAAFGIIITQKLLAEMRTLLADALPDRIEIAPMGVEVDRFVRTTPYQPWAGEGELRLVSCGRLNACKGHDDAIRAVAQLRGKNITAHLDILGEGAERAKLETLITDLDLADRVTLSGAIAEEQVCERLEHAHIFVLASHHEPLGVAIMEAMAMQTPVVVTGAGGVKELIDDQVDGMLVSPHDPQALASAIEQVARDPGLAASLSASARAKIERDFHSRRSAETLLGLLNVIPRTVPAEECTPNECAA